MTEEVRYPADDPVARDLLERLIRYGYGDLTVREILEQPGVSGRRAELAQLHAAAARRRSERL